MTVQAEPVQAEPKPADAMTQEPPIIAVTTPIAEAEPSKAETAPAPVDRQDDLRGTELATAAHDPVRGDATTPPDVSHQDADVLSQPLGKPAETPGGNWWVLIGYALLVGILVLALVLSPTAPKSASALVDSGNAYYQKYDYDHAIADYTEAIRLNPEYAVAFYNRGSAYNNKRDYDRAIADFTEAIRLDPKDRDGYAARGNAYFGKQDYPRAIADYTEAIRIDPKYALALFYRGQAKQKIGDAKGGAADIASARAIDPNVGK